VSFFEEESLLGSQTRRPFVSKRTVFRVKRHSSVKEKISIQKEVSLKKIKSTL